MHLHNSERQKQQLLDSVNYILNADDPAEELRLVDRYVMLYNKNPERFVLPSAHANLYALISSYVTQPNEFIVIVERIRDRIFSSEGATSRYKQLQVFMRELVVRQSQVERRVRRKAVNDKLQLHFPNLTATQRKELCAIAEKMWTEDRAYQLESARQMHGGVLPLEERDALLAEFWQAVTDEVAAEVAAAPDTAHLPSREQPFWARMLKEIASISGKP